MPQPIFKQISTYIRHNFSFFSVLHGFSLCCFLAAAIILLTILINITSAIYYPGQNNCLNQSSAAYNGDDQILYCPESRINSGVVIEDKENYLVCGRIPKRPSQMIVTPTRYNTIYWDYSPTGQKNVNLFQLQLNYNATILIEALVDKPVLFVIQSDYKTNYQHTYYPSKDKPKTFSYLFKSKHSTRYFFDFHPVDGENQGAIYIETNETIFAHMNSSEMTDIQKINCNYQFDWGSTDCIVTTYNRTRDFQARRWCVIMLPQARAGLWSILILVIFLSFGTSLILCNWSLKKILKKIS